jgi:hypothetical protein
MTDPITPKPDHNVTKTGQIKKWPRKRLPTAPRVTVVVTEEVIEAAKVRDSSHCMIAEAIKDAAPGAKSISVDLQTIRWSDPEKGLRYTYLTPRIAQVPLIMFDQGKTPAEFTFELRGAQVTFMSTRKNSGVAPRGRTDKQLASDRRLAELGRNTKMLRSSSATDVPRVVGGEPPPLGPLARRRAFGLRALKL